MRAAARVLALLIAGALGAGVLSGCIGAPDTHVPSPSPSLQSPVHDDTELPETLQHSDPQHSLSPLVPITEAQVLKYCPATPAEHFAGLVLAVELVYICRADGHKQTDGVYTFGPWQSVVQVLSPATLLRAYSVADAPQRTPACTVSQPVADPLIIWVHSAGTTHAYYAPIDVCGWPQTRAAQDYAQASDGRELVEIDSGSIGDPSSLPYPAEH